MTEPVKNEDLQKDFDIRLKKVERLEELGFQAWPEFCRNSTNIGIACDKIKAADFKEDEVWALSGRLMLKRDHGKIYFGTIKDSSGSIQIYLKSDIVGIATFDVFVKLVDIGDFLWVKGQPFITKTGEATIKVVDFKLISKCLRPLPEKFHGLTDVEQRYRQRYLDLLCNSESKYRFEVRSKVISFLRTFLTSRSFLEVETPMLHPIAGGATARPFVTHHNTCDMDLFLRIAPELYLKRLVVGGFDRVFEINRNFRNEGMSTKHNPEFTMLEFYMAYGDWRDGVTLLKEILRTVALSIHSEGKFYFGEHLLDFTQDFKTLDMFEAIVEFGDFAEEDLTPKAIDKTFIREGLELNPALSYGDKIFTLFDERIESKLIQPVFITGYPIEVSPLAKKDPNDSTKAARFEMFICGVEIANGYTELNDPLDQAKRFTQQLDAKKSGNVEAHDYDSDYILALEYGLPPTVGVGIGIDRLVMLLTNTQSIKDVILFPTLRSKT